MKRSQKVVAKLLTTSVLLGMIISVAHADAKVYPGSMAVKYSSGGTLVYSASAVGNSDPVNYAYVDLPIINDTMAASISDSFVKVLDRSPTYNHRCSVNSVYWNTTFDTWFGSWGANKYSTGYGDQLQQLNTNGIGGSSSRHEYFSCRIPPKHAQGTSYIVQYWVNE